MVMYKPSSQTRYCGVIRIRRRIVACISDNPLYIYIIISTLNKISFKSTCNVVRGLHSYDLQQPSWTLQMRRILFAGRVCPHKQTTIDYRITLCMNQLSPYLSGCIAASLHPNHIVLDR